MPLMSSISGLTVIPRGSAAGSAPALCGTDSSSPELSHRTTEGGSSGRAHHEERLVLCGVRSHPLCPRFECRVTAVARNRDEGPRGPKIGLEDVNAAAGEYNKYKREEQPSRDTF